MPDSADTHVSGSVSASISNAVVRIFHEYTGRGPTKARTDINSNSVVVLMADTLTKGERVLVESGQPDLVLHTRETFQQIMREDLVATVEGLTERKVMAFMSENHIDPDMAAEIFVLEPDTPSAAEAAEPLAVGLPGKQDPSRLGARVAASWIKPKPRRRTSMSPEA